MSWNEHEIQDVVYVHCAIKNHELIVPNSCLFGWEADMISVTRTGFIHEFEIKCSRSDFLADSKKRKHSTIVNPRKKFYWGETRVLLRPNYFHYVVPEGMVTPDELPPYAGLLYALKPVANHALYFGSSRVIHPATRIHSEKIVEVQRRQLERSLINRFWRQRLNNKSRVDTADTPGVS